MDMEILDLAKKIPPATFELLAEKSGIQSLQRSRARSVLVDGLSVSDAAIQADVTEEMIRRAVRAVAGSVRETNLMTQSHFDLAISRTHRVKPKNIELARRVLVEGESTVQLAKEAGLTPSTLKKLTAKIRRLAVPEGWRTITVTLPEYVAQGVEQMEIQSYTDYLEDKKEQ